MARTHYRNGDELNMPSQNCDGCQMMTVSTGGLIASFHEQGCPYEWKDSTPECPECGCKFTPEERDQRFCSPCCAAAYNGVGCDCLACEEMRRYLEEEED